MKFDPRTVVVVLIALIGLAGLFFADLAHAVEPQQTTVTQTTAGSAATLTSDGQGLALQNQDRILARIWGLTDEEMQRAQLLLRGPRAAFSVANLTPIEALGIHARSAAERRHYAELFARTHHQDTERVLAWAVAFEDALHRLYPNEPVISFDGQAKVAATPAAAEANHLPEGSYVPLPGKVVQPAKAAKLVRQ